MKPQAVLPALAWVQALRNPQLALAWTLPEWERVVRLARRLRLLARLAEMLAAAALMEQVPPQVRRHLVSEQRLSAWRIQSARWVMQRVSETVGETAYPWILLKGGAYMAQGLPIAAGRMPADVDIMVPREHLSDALKRLSDSGWVSAELDAHDRRYYEEWGHEVPPMTHPLHTIELDLHHNILPPVARTNVDASLLLQRLRPSGMKGWWVLDPVDQLLHSAAHLFHDSEPRDRLRDLVDIDGLVAMHAADSMFWPQTAARAIELGLTESLALACSFSHRYCGTSVPQAELAGVMRAGLPAARRLWLLPLLERLMLPLEPDRPTSWPVEFAAFVFLARYQLQRLPVRHLVPHVWHKMAGRKGQELDPKSEY
jgi:hypothetical protein